MNRKSRGLLMANLYFKTKDFSMAEKSLLEHLDANPDDWEGLRLMAQIHEHNRNVDRAFEMHERRYMLDPSRTGAILDACRVLLMSEVVLDKVDYRKWYELGKDTFGASNPIIKQLGDLVKTLPASFSAASSLPSQVQTVNRPTGDDPLLKILEKLTIIESRLEEIENKMGNMSLAENKTAATLMATPQKPTLLETKPREPTLQKPVPQEQTTQKPAPREQTTPAVQAVLSVDTHSLFGQPKLSFGQIANSSSQQAAPTTNLFSFASGSQMGSGWGSNAQPVFSFSSVSSGQSHNQDNVCKNVEDAKKEVAPEIISSPPQAAPTSNLFSFASDSRLGSGWGVTPAQPVFSFKSGPSQSQNHDNEGEGEDAQANDGEDAQNEVPIENFCTLKPIEQKTGEEDDTLLSSERCKLFRLTGGEWKERGLDNIRVLKNNKTRLGRLVMRLQQTGKLCLNCWNFTKIGRPNEKMVQWGALDHSDSECETRVFLAKFRTKEMADTFQKQLEDFAAGSPDLNKSDSTKDEVEIVDPTIDQNLVEKAKALLLPDLFYHNLKYNEPCESSE